RWGLTAGAFAVGSIAAGAALGGVLGAAGGLVVGGGRLGMIVAGAAALVAGAADLALPGRLPTPHRQVDEDWLSRYRGWVYGIGFGGQLGLGVVTVVTTATVYAWLVAAVMSGSALAGVVAGAGFGVARAVPLLVVRQADTPAALRRLIGRLTALASPARLGTAGASLAIGAGALWSRW
ncbi:MAG TPA: hypothetical protein VGI06_15415, partial [Acidimicrobiales bacterium]